MLLDFKAFINFLLSTSGIAALTVGIRQLVITNITGRSLSGSHVYNSDQAIYQNILDMIGHEYNYEEYGDEEYSEYIEEEKLIKATEDEISEKFSSNFFPPVAESKTGRVVCYGRLGVCLTRSVLMSLKDINNEGVVLGGLLGAAMEIVTTGSMQDAWQGLAKIDHVIHARGCLRDLSSC